MPRETTRHYLNEALGYGFTIALGRKLFASQYHSSIDLRRIAPGVEAEWARSHSATRQV